MFFRKSKVNGDTDSGHSPEEAFWSWFQQAKLLGVEGHELLRRVGPELAKIHEVLVAEVGPVDQMPRELIFSADGIKEGIVYVERLVDAAPDLKEWKLTRFRPPRKDYMGNAISFNGEKRSPEGLRYLAREHNALHDLTIFADWYDEPGQPDGALFILLDMAIGEYDVMCRVGDISVYPLNHAPGDAKSWSELRDEIHGRDDEPGDPH